MLRLKKAEKYETDSMMLHQLPRLVLFRLARQAVAVDPVEATA
jgi:hypothetical protein